MKTLTLGFFSRLLVAALLLGGIAVAGPPAGGTEYGDGVRAGHSMAISELLADPESYVDKDVQVEGVIIDVCSKMGCWIEIAASEKSSDSIRLKVEDGVMVFPGEIQGRWAQARGRLHKMELTEVRARARAEHFAEEQGEEFDPETIQGPQTIYQIDGSGVMVSPEKKTPKS